jgi:hypothetical protein
LTLQYKSGTTTEAESGEVAVLAEGLIQEPERVLERGGRASGEEGCQGAPGGIPWVTSWV